MPPPIRRGVGPARLLMALGYLSLAAVTYWYFHTRATFLQSLPSPPSPAPVAATNALVPLEAHIMSKCPDARDCLRELVLPAMQKAHEKVNFTLSFIGKPTDEDDGVACKHGPEECLGNIIELCAQRLYPDPKTFLGFTMCLMRDYKHIPQRSLVEDCALEHAIDFNQLNDCATKDDGAFGIGMLRDSVERTAKAGSPI
ncbi:cbe33a7f-bba7-4ed9-a087-ba18f75c1d7a [Thermothielavioides terrestris]|uniref:Cbe33a7f-bba7-4ed9-a087-ba18f75c1d7a n=1 Tax=Thermothielavioides terrestris TaxID=2587410 RepID=A0A3S4B949_9PEZI|nr:cbe33a7f-bba7-4ed9-a087-ba18f75c1d7a [Thermothielavioides terrestris]